MREHVEKWRQEATFYCEQTDQKVDNYLAKIRTLGPMIGQNKENIGKVKSEIMQMFERLLEKLNNEKNELLGTLDRIEGEKWDACY